MTSLAMLIHLRHTLSTCKHQIVRAQLELTFNSNSVNLASFCWTFMVVKPSFVLLKTMLMQTLIFFWGGGKMTSIDENTLCILLLW